MASKRGVRAFASVATGDSGRLQQDHGRGSEADRQTANTGEFMSDGGNSAGRSVRGIAPYFADNFQGRSGTPDNQSIHRPKGST